MTLDIMAQKTPFLMTTIGDFNVKSKNWYSQDETSSEGKTIESITSQFGLYQLINKPTYSYIAEFFFVHRPNIYIVAKFAMVVLTRLFILTVIIKSLIHYPIPEKQLLNVSEEQLAISIGKKPSITIMLPRKYLLSIKQS